MGAGEGPSLNLIFPFVLCVCQLATATHVLTPLHTKIPLRARKFHFDSMWRKKAKETSESSDGDRTHRFRKWLNKEKDSKSPTSKTTVAAGSITTVPAAPANLIAKENLGESAPASTSVTVTPVDAKVNQTKSMMEEEQASTPEDTASSVLAAARVTVVDTTELVANKSGATDKKPKQEAKTELEPVTALQQAVKRLNDSIQRLYKINGWVDDELRSVTDVKTDGAWWESSVNPPALKIDNLDSEIKRVTELTDELLSNRRKLAESQESRQGILPATMNFLRTAGHALAPCTKVLLAAASQGSSLVQSPPKIE